MAQMRFVVGRRPGQTTMKIGETAATRLAKATKIDKRAARSAVEEPDGSLTPTGLHAARQYAWSVLRGHPDLHAEKQFEGTALEYVFSKMRANRAIASFYAGE